MTTLKNIKANGGATLNANGEAVNYNKGYQVSIKDLYIMPVYKMTKKFIKTLLNDKYNLGLWIDNNKVYIDYSVNIKTKKEAVKVGKANNQISIWNWKKMDCIYL